MIDSSDLLITIQTLNKLTLMNKIKLILFIRLNNINNELLSSVFNDQSTEITKFYNKLYKDNICNKKVIYD